MSSEKDSGDPSRLSSVLPQNDSEKQTPRPPATVKSISKSLAFLGKLPPWVSVNLRTHRSWKLWARCWLAAWISFIILLPNKSLSVLGNTAFFTLLISFMVPPMMPVQVFVFVMATIVLGVCLGWGFGSAAMRAALASRDQVLLQSLLQREAQSTAGLANPDALFQVAIFNGDFLDTRSSIVFGCFLGFTTFFMGLIRAYAPKLTIMSVFGTIAVDIFCSYGPLFPFVQYTILNSLLTSVACYIALSIILIVLVFPETINHAYLTSTSTLLDKLVSMIEMQKEVLEASPEDLAEGTSLHGKVYGARSAVVGQLQQQNSQLNMINLEFSFGKWNGDDIKALQEPLLALVSRTSALQSFAKIVGSRSYREIDDSSESISAAELSGTVPFANDTHLMRQLRARHNAGETEHSLRLSDILPNVDNATLALREACATCIRSTRDVVNSVNCRRYAKDSVENTAQRTRELEATTTRLKQELETFKESGRQQLVNPFRGLLDIEKNNDLPRVHTLPLRSLYISYVFASNLVVVGSATLGLAELVLATSMKRTRNRLWAPKGLRAIGKLVFSRNDGSARGAGEENVPDEETEETREEQSYRMDPDSKPPTNVVQRFANNVHSLYIWFKTPEAIFAVKYTFISIALWLPSVFRHSAHFNYVEKGIWALIMAQTTLNIYASDQIFNYVMRLGGTFVGAVLGMLCWYIGAGHGTGNRYGLAAIVAVFAVPLMFARVFAPPQLLPGVLLGTVTFALVIGYSWLDGHITTIGNAGIGWGIAWKRWVLVVIGSAASFILMMLPPQSGRRAVRRRNAAVISNISYIYSHLMSTWISDSDSDATEVQPMTERAGDKALWKQQLRQKVLGVSEQIQALRSQTAFAKWEGNIRGAWPFEEYNRLIVVEGEMVAALAQLGGALAQLDRRSRVAFLHQTKFVNPNFITDVMSTFALVSQALRTGEPMNQVFHQNLLDRLIYHGNVAYPAPVGDDPPKGGHADLLDLMTTYDYMFFATGISAILQLLEGLNELRRITSRLCGEVPLPGFTRWKEEYERAHITV